jgi:hypothetical protein
MYYFYVNETEVIKGEACIFVWLPGKNETESYMAFNLFSAPPVSLLTDMIYWMYPYSMKTTSSL